MQSHSDMKLYCYLWDSECQGYVEISIDKDGRLFGFPNSRDDGLMAHEVLLLSAVFPEAESENGTV